MNHHIALYRTWRPQTFQEIVGQAHIIQTLQNSLKEGRISHAYLFSGPRGTGKTSAAKILAKAVNCQHGSVEEPCNECEVCRRITEGSLMDVIELDAASNNGVDEIRDIRDKVKYAPTEVLRKVYIIDEVHMLTVGAFNALLKTLEEPPPHVMFILATTEPHKLPVTIISRCQRFDFRRVKIDDQISWLRRICEQEGLDAEERALQHVARLSDGYMRDALSLLDQILSFSGNTISYEQAVAVTGGISSEQFQKMAAAIQSYDLGTVLDMIESWMLEGKSAEKGIESLIHYFRDLLMIGMIPQASLEQRMVVEPEMKRLAESFNRERLFEMIEVLNQYQNEMKYASQPHILFEVALMKVCNRLSDSTEERPPAPAAAASFDQTAHLEQKLLRLESQVQALLSSAAVPKSAEGQNYQASADSIVAKSTPAKPAAGLIKKVSSGQLSEFVKARGKSEFKEILLQWSSVLSKVKDTKITVHAWLVDGEPVSRSEDTVLVAFKNTIHRNTTEKPANKEVIEQVMLEVFGQPLKLQTLMLKDWEQAQSDGMEETPQEVLQLEPEEQPAGGYKEEWINEAIELFGEDMVVIKEDE